MVPSSGSYQHGRPASSDRTAAASSLARLHHDAPSLGWVVLPRPSPPSSLLCGPPTSWHPSASAPVPLALGLPLWKVLFFASFRVHLQNTKSPRSFLSGAPSAATSRGDVRISQITGPSSSCVPWPTTPLAVSPPSPICAVRDSAAFRPSETLGCARIVLSMADAMGPHARLPTHQRSRYRLRSKADYRPAGLSFSRVGFAPTGQLFRISRRHRQPPIPSDQHFLVASGGGRTTFEKALKLRRNKPMRIEWVERGDDF